MRTTVYSQVLYIINSVLNAADRFEKFIHILICTQSNKNKNSCVYATLGPSDPYLWTEQHACCGQRHTAARRSNNNPEQTNQTKDILRTDGWMENSQMEAVRSVKQRGVDKWFAHFPFKILVLWNILCSESKTEQTTNKTYTAEDRRCPYKGRSAGWGLLKCASSLLRNSTFTRCNFK